MDPVFEEFQFLDLSGMNDAELSHLQSVLYSSDPGVKYPELPWVEPARDEGSEEAGLGCNPPSTLNPEVPPYPSSSSHMPMPYAMMPSVYVNNVTANVSVHPYLGYHAVQYDNRGRRPGKPGPKRDYHHAGDQGTPQQYPNGPYIPMPYYYPPPGHMQSAQQATGAPIFLPGPTHAQMYSQPMGYPTYQPAMYSPVESPTMYATDPEKIRGGYEYARKEQYQNDPAMDTYQREMYASEVKEPAIVNFSEKVVTNYNNNCSEAVVTHYASKSVVSNVSEVKTEEVNNLDVPSAPEVVEKVPPIEETSVKLPGITYVSDVIVSDLKTDAQVFRPANRNIVVNNTITVEVNKEPASESADITAPVLAKPVEPIPVEIVIPVVEKVVVEFPPPAPQTVEAAPAVADPAPASSGKSWASLFKKNTASVESDNEQVKLVARVEPYKSQEAAQDAAPTEAEVRRAQKQIDDPQLYRLGEFLAKYELDHRAISLQPRGLTNRGNWCYVNSTLQALLACPPFYNLMKALPPARRGNKSHTPILDSIVEFVNEFIPLSAATRSSRKERSHRKEDGSMDVQSGAAFEPAHVYKMLNNIRTDAFKVEGRQEDAEEFLSCLLNALNDEMLEVVKLVQDGSEVVTNGDTSATSADDDTDSEWTVMGPKNKGAVTRRSDFGRTPVSDIFRGHLRSRVQRAGDQSTDNVQPFFTLQLDIEKAQSVKEALELLVGRDQLEGVTCTKTNQEVEAWQQVTLEDLPLVLVLHLKWFDYRVEGCTKIVKSVEFPIELKVDPKLMSSNKKYGVKAKQYKLFAVVYHDGKEASKGHYVTDAFHVGYGGWVRYDDSAVRAVQEAQVLRPKSPRVPYLLYYRRCDTIGTQVPTR